MEPIVNTSMANTDQSQETEAPTENGGSIDAPAGDSTAPAQQSSSGEAHQDVVFQGADGIKEAVAEKSETAGNLVETLDSLAFSAGSLSVSLWDILLVVLVIAAVFTGAYLLSKLAHKVLGQFTTIGDAQQLLLEKIASLLIWVVALLIGVDILGIDLTAFAVFSGAFGLAIGFGLQKTFGNLIAGIILLMDKSIKPGDVIAIADQAGNETFGQIRKIGIRAVSVTTRDQREYLIPNENLMINQVENWSYSSRNVRMQVDVGVSYDADIAQAEELMLKAADGCERVLRSPPPTVWLKEYGDSSVNFTIHCWIRDPENGTGNVRSDVLKKLWWLLKEADIEIPFPQRDLNLRNNQQVQDLVGALRGRVLGGESDEK